MGREPESSAGKFRMAVVKLMPREDKIEGRTTPKDTERKQPRRVFAFDEQGAEGGDGRTISSR